MGECKDRYDPPEPWRRPVQETQLSLFPYPLDEYLAFAQVSKDDLRRWRQQGWISFDVDALSEFHHPTAYEMVFVRNLARSGLSDEQINQLLEQLPKPYSYEPLTTAYHFAHGWVQAPAPLKEPYVVEFVEEHIDEWAKAQVEEGNAERVFDLLADAVRLSLARKEAEKAAGKEIK